MYTLWAIHFEEQIDEWPFSNFNGCVKCLKELSKLKQFSGLLVS